MQNIAHSQNGSDNMTTPLSGKVCCL